MLPPHGQEVIPVEEPLVFVGPHTSRLAIEDPDQPVKLGGCDVKYAVDLFLVLGQVDGGPRVGKEVFDLGGGVGGVKADSDAPDSHRGQVQDDPLRAILGLDGHPVGRFHPEGQQAMGRVEDQPPCPFPCVLLPDTEVLLPHGHLAWRSPGPVPGHRGDGHRALWGRGSDRFLKRRSH